MPKRTALLVCNSPRRRSKRRKKTRPRRMQRMALHSFKPNFPYKYNSTAPQNCQVRLKIHKSVTLPSYVGNEPDFNTPQSIQNSPPNRPFSRLDFSAQVSKCNLRYFVNSTCFTGIFSAFFRAFFALPAEDVHLCKYYLPVADELLACATICPPPKSWSFCTISDPIFLHVYKITKSHFF